MCLNPHPHQLFHFGLIACTFQFALSSEYREQVFFDFDADEFVCLDAIIRQKSSRKRATLVGV